MFQAGIITISDKGAKGEREDKSGPLIREILERVGIYQVKEEVVIPDEKEEIKKELIRMADALNLDLILTTGGTGLSLRDVTPEATLEIAHRQVPGIAEAMRSYSMTITKRGMLSRGVSVVRNQTLIINLPGSPKAVKENLDYILSELSHGIEILRGNCNECGNSEGR